MNQIAFLVLDLQQLPIHATLYSDGIDRSDCAEAGHIHADITCAGFYRNDRYDGRRSPLALCAFRWSAGGAFWPEEIGTGGESGQNQGSGPDPPAAWTLFAVS